MGVAYGGEEVEANRWVWLMEGRRWRLTGGCGGVHLMEGRAGRWKSVHLKEGGGLTGGGG